MRLMALRLRYSNGEKQLFRFRFGLELLVAQPKLYPLLSEP